MFHLQGHSDIQSNSIAIVSREQNRFLSFLMLINHLKDIKINMNVTGERQYTLNII